MKRRTARSTSQPVAAKASRVLRDPTSTADEKAVAASALAQVDISSLPRATAEEVRGIVAEIDRAKSAGELSRGEATFAGAPVVEGRKVAAVDDGRVIFEDQLDKGTAMGKRGPKGARDKAVEALESKGMGDAAAVVREATGLPPKPRTPQQDFILTVRDTVDQRIGTVGFPCVDLAELTERESILRGLKPPDGYKYRPTRKSDTYLEVALVGE